MSEHAVKLFKRKLTNLSSANPQLWISRLKTDFHFDFKELEIAQVLNFSNFLDQLLSGKKEIVICPTIDSRDNSVNQLGQKLGNIARKQKLIFQERGVDELYISFPFVSGLWPDGSKLRTPFLLIPLRLERDLKNWIIYPDVSEAFINPAFLLAYSFHFKVSLDQPFYEREVEFSGTDALSFLTNFYNVLKESKIEIKFNQDLFLRQIESVHPILKDTALSGFSPGILKLEPHVVLGIFPQSDSVLVPDFDFFEANEISLDDIFLKQAEGLKEVSEKNLFCPLPVDGSQENVIKQVKSGRSLVVQGPPGTGKSQLISNLMADAMGAGKSVLLVCQKRIALEVVQNRLHSVGLGQFVGLWSDYKKDRDPVYKQIKECIDELSETEAKNNGLDTVVLERNFHNLSNQIDQISLKLENWKSALYEIETAGISIKELYALRGEKQIENHKSDLYSTFKKEEWAQFLRWISLHWDELSVLLKSDFPFKNRKNWFLKGEEFMNSIPEKWELISIDLQRLEKEYQEICISKAEDKDFSVLLRKKVLIFAILNIDNHFSIKYGYLLSDFKKFISSEAMLNDGIKKWKKIYSVCQNIGTWPSTFEIKISEIDELLADIEQYEKYIHVKIVKQIAIFVNSKIARIARFEPLFQSKATWLEDLKRCLKNSKELAEISRVFLGKEIEVFNANQFNDLMYRHEQFIKDLSDLKIHQNAFFTISKFIKEEHLNSYVEFNKATSKLGKEAVQLEILLENWNDDFETDQTNFLLSEYQNLNIIIDQFLLQKSAIWNMDQEFLNFPKYWKTLAEEIVNLPGIKTTADSILKQQQISWVKHWIEKMEFRQPLLASIDKLSWLSDLDLLRNSIEEKRNLVSNILKLRLTERTYKNLEVNRLGNRLTYRNLYHQVSKKRIKAPLRKLWLDHEDEIKRIIPAWLATPESVSATWPISTKFDLVIFDESSQCFAERGIPAAFRANQIVIVGDDKQLPPNQLFTTRWEDNENEDDAVFFEQNSLLDLGQQFLPQSLLKGHYRSVFPELISFSNEYFYDGKLEFLPDRQALKKRKPALQWIKVDGNWLNQQNQEEAREVATSIFSFIDSHPNETLGIITFNAKQQILIEKEIEIESVAQERIVPDWLFVKNIENVQGDERDHIWFSIAYARNEQNKIVAQFGTLSQPGGENRLNVAITRARKSITVYSSILPSELPTTENSPEGPKLLKKYLDFVFKSSQTDLEEGQIHFDPNTIGYPQMHGLETYWIFNDGPALYDSNSMKDYFAYKFLTLTRKGFNVKYEFSRR